MMILATMGYGKKYEESNKNLQSVPKDIPADTTELFLKMNRITTIPKDSFKQLTVCIKLFLSNNQIATIADGAFNGLEKLEELHLSRNKLQEIRKEMWKGLVNNFPIQTTYLICQTLKVLVFAWVIGVCPIFFYF